MVALVLLIGTKTPILGVLAHGLKCKYGVRCRFQFYVT